MHCNSANNLIKAFLAKYTLIFMLQCIMTSIGLVYPTFVCARHRYLIVHNAGNILYHIFYLCIYSIQRYNAFKHHWSDNRISTILQVTACSLNQVNPANNKKLCSYDYKDMEGVTLVSKLLFKLISEFYRTNIEIGISGRDIIGHT